MKGMFFLLLIPFSLQASIILESNYDKEIWEGDTVKATLRASGKELFPLPLEFTDGIYLLDQNKVDESHYELRVIITDREKLNSIGLKKGKEITPVIVKNFRFKKDKIKSGSYIFNQSLSHYGGYIVYILLFIMTLGGAYFFLRWKKRKAKERKYKEEKSRWVSLIKEVKDKDSFNAIYYQRDSIKKFFDRKKDLVADFFYSSQEDVYQETINEDDMKKLISRAQELANKLEREEDGI